MIVVAISAFLVGMIFFYTMAVFELSNGAVWNDVYYIWDKTAGGGTLVWYALYISCKQYKKQLGLVLFYSILRIVWEILAICLGYSADNPVAASVLFLIVAIVIGAIMLISIPRK